MCRLKVVPRAINALSKCNRVEHRGGLDGGLGQVVAGMPPMEVVGRRHAMAVATSCSLGGQAGSWHVLSMAGTIIVDTSMTQHSLPGGARTGMLAGLSGRRNHC
jgi:hypothetical protein